MTKSIIIYERKEIYGRDGFKLTVADDINSTVCITAETVKEGIETMITYGRLTPREIMSMGYKMVAAGEMFKNGQKIDVKA